MKDGVGHKYQRGSCGGFMEREASEVHGGHVSDVCPVLSLSTSVSKHPCAVPLIGNKDFWKRKSDKSGGC